MIDAWANKELVDLIVEAREQLNLHNASASHRTSAEFIERLTAALAKLGYREPTGVCVGGVDHSKGNVDDGGSAL